MGVQDTGCLRYVPWGYGVVRGYNGACRYLRNDQHITPHFRMREFNPANVHPWGIVEKLARQLQTMRYILGAPIIITSGYRREANTHGSGLGVDIVVPRRTFIKVAQAAHDAGFRRIEVQRRSGTSFWSTMSVGGHIHLDVYDGTGHTTGTMYDCPTCDRLPLYPWYAWGVQNSWYATARPNTFQQLMTNLRINARRPY